MSGYPPAPWNIRPERTPEASYVVWSASGAVASDIQSLDAARVIQAAPELFEFAKMLCLATRPTEVDVAAQLDLGEVLAFCRLMRRKVEQSPNRSSQLDSIGRESTSTPPPTPSRSEVEAAKARALNNPAPVSTAITSRPFDEQFQTVLRKISEDALLEGISLKDLASEAGISRAQFSRWRRETPLTIRTVTKLQFTLAARQSRTRDAI